MLLVMMTAFGPKVRVGLPHFSIIIPGMEIWKKSIYSMYDCNSIQYSHIWNSPQNFKKRNKEVFEMKRTKTNTIDN